MTASRLKICTTVVECGVCVAPVSVEKTEPREERAALISLFLTQKEKEKKMKKRRTDASSSQCSRFARHIRSVIFEADSATLRIF
jgi:hypothetical protein